MAELSQLRMSEMTELRATCPEVEKFGAILRIEIPPGASDASSSEVKPEVTHEVKPEVRVCLPADYPDGASLHRLIGRHGARPRRPRKSSPRARGGTRPAGARTVCGGSPRASAGAQALEAEIEGIQAAHPVWRRVDRGGGTVLRIDIPGQKRGGMSPWIELILPETYPGWSLWHARFKPEIKSHGRKEVEAQAKLDAMMAATPWGQPVLAPYVAWVVRKARVVHEVKDIIDSQPWDRCGVEQEDWHHVTSYLGGPSRLKCMTKGRIRSTPVARPGGGLPVDSANPRARDRRRGGASLAAASEAAISEKLRELAEASPACSSWRRLWIGSTRL